MPQDGLREHGKVKLNRETGYCSLIAEDETEGKAKAFMSNFLFKAFSSTNAKIPKAVMDCLHYQVDSLMIQYDILLSLPFLPLKLHHPNCEHFGPGQGIMSLLVNCPC